MPRMLTAVKSAARPAVACGGAAMPPNGGAEDMRAGVAEGGVLLQESCCLQGSTKSPCPRLSQSQT